MTTAARAYQLEVGGFFAAHGLPPVAGRIFGHLLICQPPEQSFETLCKETGASRGSVSTMTRLLAQLGLVERIPAGGRELHYRIHGDAWTRLLEDDLRSATRLRELAVDGLKLLGRGASRRRLTTMREFYGFLEQETARALQAWKKR